MSMTFDLSPEQLARQARARDIAATHLMPAAEDIDAAAAVPASVLEAIDTLALWQGDMVTAMLLIEELACASPSAAALGALGVKGTPTGVAGLRGVPHVDAPGERDHLAMAAVCLGIGRAALGEALRAARARGDRPAGDPGDPPHWVLADAATDVAAARLLLHASATGAGLPPAGVVVNAAGAATRAVDAAVRVVGAEGYRERSVLERCARDARAVWFVLGSEDHVRRAAADALLA